MNYTVTASASSTTSNYHVDGDIRVVNISNAISIDSVVDNQGPVTCTGITFPYVIGVGGSITCTDSGDPTSPPAANTVTANITSDGSVSATAPINWSQATNNETDECAAVSDTFGGTLGTVCAGQTTTFSLQYSRNVGPYAVCGEYDVPNTASFVTNDTGTTSSAGANVHINIPCAAAAPSPRDIGKLTPSSARHPTMTPGQCFPMERAHPFYLSGQTWYQVFWIPPRVVMLTIS